MTSDIKTRWIGGPPYPAVVIERPPQLSNKHHAHEFEITSPQGVITVKVSPTGKMRVFRDGRLLVLQQGDRK